MKASDLQELEDNTEEPQAPASTIVSAEELKACEQSKAPSASHDEELKARINAIIKARESSDQARAARKDCYERPTAAVSGDSRWHTLDHTGEPQRQPSAAPNIDADLQGRMNAIVNARKQQQQACSGVSDLQAWVVGLQSPGSSWKAHAERYRQSQVASGKDGGLQEQVNMIVGAHATSLKQQRLSLDLSSPVPSPSPSPAKLVPDWELGYIANRALSQAKERNTPAASPPSLQQVNWMSYEDDIAPRHLSFAGCGASCSNLEEIDSSASCTAQVVKKCVNDETCALNLSEIPSPTRNRAKKQRSLWADVDIQEMAAEEVQHNAPADEPELTAAEQDASAASHKEISAKLLRQLAEKEEMAEMSKICVNTFLESVKKCAWREHVRTPIKGSNLYTKHIRPCRPAGTSVDVKDSTFRNLGTFLQFLEAEWLLRLKPGLSDPVVNEIYFNACRKYKYDAQRQERFLAATLGAPHEAGCACRLCIPCTLDAPWQ